MNTKGSGKKNTAMEADKGKRALPSEVGVATPQVKPLVLIKVLAEKYRTRRERYSCAWDKQS